VGKVSKAKKKLGARWGENKFQEKIKIKRKKIGKGAGKI
jgi:hypothetical protein